MDASSQEKGAGTGLKPAAPDTIVAVATPLGEGGLGVVRVSGPDAVSIASKIFSSGALASAPGHTLHHGWILKGPNPLDEAVAALFRAPASYTGEDVVEFSCHGSPAVLTEVVRLCEEKGARHARPGEFTERAYLNGKLDLLQAEAVADLIHARSSAARAAAASQLRGALSERIGALRSSLVDLLAHVEANLDFVEEDIPALPGEELGRKLADVKAGIDELLATAVRGRLLREGVRVALVGRPNVGKSSLFNALLAQDRAIVSDVAGTTRDTLEEQLQWDGLSVVVTDTAGLRDSRDAIEREGVERTRRAAGAADVALLVVDGSAPLHDEDRAARASLNGRPVIAVLNKSDRGLKLSSTEASRDLRALAAVETSAATGAGLAALRAAVLSAVGAGSTRSKESEDAVVVSNLRHARHLESAAFHLENARGALAAGRSEEALASDLRAAAEELSAITGQSVHADVLTSIFSRFCVGK